MDQQSAASRIEQGCSALGISVAELCRRAQLPARNYISRMKTGDVSGRKHLAAIADALGCSVAWISEGTGAPPAWATKAMPDGLEAARQANAMLAEQLAAAQAEIRALQEQLAAERQTRQQQGDQALPLADAEEALRARQRRPLTPLPVRKTL